MDINGIVQIIQSVGFPIVCCGALFWKMNEDQKQHAEESSKTTEALNNNTLVLQKLCDKMGETK